MGTGLTNPHQYSPKKASLPITGGTTPSVTSTNHISLLTSHVSLLEISGLFHGPFGFVLIQFQGLLQRGFAGYETGDVLTDGGA